MKRSKASLCAMVAAAATFLLQMTQALAWSAGPYPLHRMAIESDACLIGRVAQVKRAGRDGGFQTMVAFVHVKRWLYGGKGRTARVLFHSRTSGMLNVPQRLQRGERVLLFLRNREHVIQHIAPTFRKLKAALPRPLYVVQFAKGRNVGYIVRLKGRKLSGFLHKADRTSLSKALPKIKHHQPAKQVRGLRAILWTHRRKQTTKGTLHFVLYLRNMRTKPMAVYTYKRLQQLKLVLRDARGKLAKEFPIFLHLALMKRRAVSLVDRKVLKSGQSARIQFSVALRAAKLPPGKYSAVLDFRGYDYPKLGAKSPAWKGKVRSNAISLFLTTSKPSR